MTLYESCSIALMFNDTVRVIQRSMTVFESYSNDLCAMTLSESHSNDLMFNDIIRIMWQ